VTTDSTGPGPGPGQPGTLESRPSRPGRAPKPAARPAAKPRRRRTVVLVLLSLAMLLAVLLVVGSAAVLYVVTQIPRPDQLPANQAWAITYSDGTQIARVGAQNRTDVPLAKVPRHVQDAVLAAEDRGYWNEPGISVRGIARALYNDVRGRDVQGGSTITQQYVKNAYLTQERTFTRKFKEIVIAVKLDHDYSKQQILQWYLNTIYYGRGAYGIEVAAQTYFHTSVSKLTVAQGAVLAASIRSPALYDPQGHPAAARARWQFVIDGMVKEAWLPAPVAARLRYPAVAPRTSNSLNRMSGVASHIVDQVKDELGNLGFDEALLNRRGLRVQTTIDPRAQHAAVAAVARVFNGEPANLRQALVAVDPASGAVRAYYGGTASFDYAQAWRPPGSSFKPYVLATALDASLRSGTGVSVYSTYDGSSPRTFGGVVVHNSEGEQCPRCTLLEAMKLSVNTVFYDLAIESGPSKVAAMAQRLGVADRLPSGQPTLQHRGFTDGSIGIGRYEVRPVDQAVGFATLAAGGVRHPAYFVQKITDPTGHVLYQRDSSGQSPGQRVLDPKVANDVTYAMEPVADYSGDGLAAGRPAAAKTGTQQFGDTNFNSDAWMVGFTPQVSAAVWVGADQPGPLRNAEGRPLYGRGLPGQTWQAFMDAYLSGQPVLPLPGSPQVLAGAAQQDQGQGAGQGQGQGAGSASASAASPTAVPTSRVPVPTVTLPLPTQPEPTRSLPTQPEPSRSIVPPSCGPGLPCPHPSPPTPSPTGGPISGPPGSHTPGGQPLSR
jgi:membrane peptidoglycan carboxypeptidase